MKFNLVFTTIVAAAAIPIIHGRAPSPKSICFSLNSALPITHLKASKKAGWHMLVIASISVGFLGLVFIALYNSLIFRKNAVEQSYGGIQAYVKERADLIPNLVSTVQVFMKHEQNLLTQIVELRSQQIKMDLPEAQQIQVTDKLSQLMKKLMISVEAYPELKSNQNVLQLQSSLAKIEEQISAARRAYNSAVTQYNNGIEMIPHIFVARVMSLEKKNVFEAPPEAQEAVNVHELFNKGA